MFNNSLPKQPACTSTTLQPRQEELLSYLQGLAPLGQAFEFRRCEAMIDLAIKADKVLYQHLRKLAAMGFIERLETGRSDRKGRLLVRQRLERLKCDDVKNKKKEISFIVQAFKDN